MWSQKPLETVSEVENFPGGACPQIPYFGYTTTCYNPPLSIYEKSCINPYPGVTSTRF